MEKEKVIVMEKNKDGVFVPSCTEKKKTQIPMSIKIKKPIQHYDKSPIAEMLEGFSIGMSYVEDLKHLLRRL